MTGQSNGQTDRRTPDRYIDPAAHTMRAVSKGNDKIKTKKRHRRKKGCRSGVRAASAEEGRGTDYSGKNSRKTVGFRSRVKQTAEGDRTL